jgi:uncharacterized protein (DUF2235 family)
VKRIFVCADGTWNRPEEDLEKDVATNVLRLARGVAPEDEHGNAQVVFYDWGLGSYHANVAGGGFGEGINKNIMDDYRFIVQNYDPGDEIFLFGFSRGAYTIRSLTGLINNCGILKRRHARRIEQAFALYKNRENHPRDDESHKFRARYATEDAPRIKFVGVWDTVGALGVPVHVLGFLNEKHVFHDNKIGPNIDVARHALAIDERRDDFEPTIWKKRAGTDLKQVWFAGVHSDVGGGYAKQKGKGLLSDIPLGWIMSEAAKLDAKFEEHLWKGLNDDAGAPQHESHEGFFKLLGKHVRPISGGTLIHESVKARWDAASSYRPEKLTRFVAKHGWEKRLTS